jgi:hypothetical protein
MSTRSTSTGDKSASKADCMNPAAMYGYDTSPVDYGYGDVDYGYGDQGPGSFVREQEERTPASNRRSSQHRSVRRNSCLVRKDANPLAVAEYLMGEPPRMSDRDLEAENSQQEVVA